MNLWPIHRCIGRKILETHTHNDNVNQSIFSAIDLRRCFILFFVFWNLMHILIRILLGFQNHPQFCWEIKNDYLHFSIEINSKFACDTKLNIAQGFIRNFNFTAMKFIMVLSAITVINCYGAKTTTIASDWWVLAMHIVFFFLYKRNIFITFSI